MTPDGAPRRPAGPFPVTSAVRPEDRWGCPAAGPATEVMNRNVDQALPRCRGYYFYGDAGMPIVTLDFHQSMLWAIAVIADVHDDPEPGMLHMRGRR